MASNVVARTDANDNIFPRKEKPENKIDGIAGIINALARITTQPVKKGSKYETEGILSV
jgi:phage terminase large subunit-like protein